MTLIIAPRAVGDLNDIEDFSARRWGDERTARYLQRFHDAFDTLVARPSSGRVVLGKFRTYHVGSHVVAYTELDDGIEVVRVFHERMNIVARLRAER